MNICVYGAARNGNDDAAIKSARLLGEKIAKRGHSLVFGGGGNGMMGAVADGVAANNGKITGIAPKFFNADGVLYDNCTEFIGTDTMRERKRLLEDLSDAFIVTPGGIGTFDELFEVFTLKSLGQLSKKIVVFNPNGYYDALTAFLKNTVEAGYMANETLDMLKFFDNADSLLDYLESDE